ncbi:hypothetical protein [Sphingomonas sp. C3-2]|uniref:hypothetical protein n=1 Tax=Sphingomonas sp. C3-2 TaxID=3062169 RepID=UPI00294AB483|nr:hypothetical protein [Sphingomonas sp. C3-2]WOK37290.1 hypothetical protein QYC26_03630 [Sphingomonas sp. C3-2]
MDAALTQAGQRVSLAAADAMAPLAQGKLDGLCGLYAIINALRLTAWPHKVLTYTDSKALFSFGTKFLHRRRQLKHVIRDGMPASLWRELADAVAAEAEPRAGIALAVLPYDAEPNSTDTTQLFDFIHSMLMAQRPVLIELGNCYRHYTVIAGISAARLELFDSWGYAHIHRNACGYGPVARQRHALAHAMAIYSAYPTPLPSFR